MSAQNVAPAPYADAPIQTGLPVYTLDNKRLGTVKEVEDGAFKVDARFRKDYWLATGQVAYVDEHCVGMLFRTDESELYKLQTPTDDPLQRRFERRAKLPTDSIDDQSLRRHFPLS
jgi:hypothetical protein